MPARRHAYFAYGSNLCVTQMALRCPDAADPRPAVLADHDWLINQRGVATVEPFAGNQVHGVLWQVSDDDLATLDSAEGVPVRYRRDRLTVHTGDGPSPAWVYIDHRVTPGPPRPGYLPQDHRRCRAPRVAATMGRLFAPLGSHPLAAPVVRHNPRAAITFGVVKRTGSDRGESAALSFRFSCHPRRRPGRDDRRHRRTRRRGRRRIGVPVHPTNRATCLRARS